jgi:hypothetical protein
MATLFPLIPRKLLLGNPERTQVEISPDGAHISFLARYLGGGCEPFGSDLAGASLEVLVGKDAIF